MKNTNNYSNNSRRNFIKNLSLASGGLYLLPGSIKLNNFAANNYPRYGCLFSTGTYLEVQEKTRNAGFDLNRIVLYLKNTSRNPKIDNLLRDGFSVALNINWQPTSVPTTFPERGDYPVLEQRAREFFEAHKGKASQIPFITIGNEWDNIGYHTNSVDYYLKALKILTRIAHEYNFLVADAGLTGIGLQRWYYTQLSGDEAQEWRRNYNVAINNPNFQPHVDKVNHYITKIRHIPIDYLNVHWYNLLQCYNGFPKAAGWYARQCWKPRLITNEFGTRSPGYGLFEQTVNEVSQYVINNQNRKTRFAIAYSGQNIPGKAIELTDEMLKLLANPVPIT